MQSGESAQQKRAKLIVSAYRALGFGILTLIVVILVGYIATSAFYFVSDSWIQPMRVAKTDERVLALQAQLAEQENVRDRVAAELNHADRYIAVQQAYQAYSDEAVRLGVFGAPTFVVPGHNERWWGQDRLAFVDRFLERLRR